MALLLLGQEAGGAATAPTVTASPPPALEVLLKPLLHVPSRVHFH